MTMNDEVRPGHWSSWSGAGADTSADAPRERRFRCRESLWRAYEQMAAELGVSVDDVVTEAMAAYERYRARASSPPEARPAHDYALDEASDLARTVARPTLDRFAAPTTEAPVPSHGARATLPTPSRPPPPPGARVAPPPPPPPVRRTTPPPFSSPSSPPPSSRAAGPRSAPPPLPSAPGVLAAQLGVSAEARALTLTYQGAAHDVAKERYLLGRSKTQADLRLHDSNVSRQHAAIERVGDGWYVVDLGSTNGVYVSGERVTRRRLADGDVIEITTHQIRCALA